MSYHHHHHFLVLSLPAQGHVNPTLQLAKILARNGARVTFATTILGLRRMKAPLPTYPGLSYASFSDGYDDEPSKSNFDLVKYMDDLKHVGSQTVATLLRNLSDEGRPVSFVLYAITLPWAATVAREVHVPSALVFIQCATSFSIFHRIFNSHDGISTNIDSSISIELPGLPLFSGNDINTFLFPTNQFYSAMVQCFEEHIKALEQDPKPCVLVNSFDALEREQLKAIANIDIIAIGPLIPSAFSDGTDPSDNSFGCNLFEKDKEYLKWLDVGEEGSVVYVSFGSLAQIKKEQNEEILHGLVQSGKPFFWVIRSSPDSEEVKVLIDQKDKLTEKGLIVSWCAQLEVLFHKSVGCFLTHCGWNSTMESMISGVPIVGCPQFADQPTNAKLVEEVWGNGVRAKANQEGVVERKEIARCLEIVMGDGEERDQIRTNAEKWRDLAAEAVKEGGSSYNNLKMFLETL